jgi:hypothetical protein
MLRFQVFHNKKPAQDFNLNGAYLVGTDGVPLRAELEFKNGEILCKKRAMGPAGLAVLWPVRGTGRILIETTRLPERDAPYNLNLELARGRLMRISQKREDWGLYEYEGLEPLARRIEFARDLLIEGLKSDDPVQMAAHGDEALEIAMVGSEELSVFHANVFLSRRMQTGSFPKRLFGCVPNLNTTTDAYRQRLIEGFDTVTLPFIWRDIEPKEQQFEWDVLDEWVDWLSKNRIQIKGSPLISFGERHLPDWAYLWENDFEHLRDLAYDHARRVLERYGSFVSVWDVVSGIHAENPFNFNFEQLMEITRLGVLLTKQLTPRAVTVVDLIAPWGEYYAGNQWTIPPLLYADMAVQSGINFDAFGLQFYFGVAREGMYVRDMFQISSMIDRFANVGRSLHITGIQVPSGPGPDKNDASVKNGGMWHTNWNEELQSLWLRLFCNVALSKPFVESLSWRNLADGKEQFLPNGGLLRADLSPKMSYRELLTIRGNISGNGAGPGKARIPPK